MDGPTPENDAEMATSSQAEASDAPASSETETATTPPATAPNGADPQEESAAPSHSGDSTDPSVVAKRWPEHMRNVLRITVPVTVTLASQRTPIHEIIELGPGTIVKFEKTCEEPLELSVGDRTIATGEVVKVGDKFGLRLGAIVKAGQEATPAQA